MKQTFKVVGEIKLKKYSIIVFVSQYIVSSYIVIVFILLFSSYCVASENKSAVCGNETK